jgi:hypothetical protein
MLWAAQHSETIKLERCCVANCLKSFREIIMLVHHQSATTVKEIRSALAGFGLPQKVNIDGRKRSNIT